MKDLAFKSEKKLTVEELRKAGEGKDVVYQVVTMYDTSHGPDLSIISVSNLDTAMRVMKENFKKESAKWIEDIHADEEDIIDMKERGEYTLEDIRAYLKIGDSHLNMYITANEVIDTL